MQSVSRFGMRSKVESGPGAIKCTCPAKSCACTARPVSSTLFQRKLVCHAGDEAGFSCYSIFRKTSARSTIYSAARPPRLMMRPVAAVHCAAARGFNLSFRVFEICMGPDGHASCMSILCRASLGYGLIIVAPTARNVWQLGRYKPRLHVFI